MTHIPSFAIAAIAMLLISCIHPTLRIVTGVVVDANPIAVAGATVQIALGQFSIGC